MSDVQRILVCGYYGFGNTGDEAILSALLADLRATHPGAIVTVLSGNPGWTSGEHDVEAIHWQDVVSSADEARRSDLMVLGGGGLFQDFHGFDEGEVLSPRHGGIGYYGGFALLSRLSRAPLAIWGVGVGPLGTEVGRRYTRIAFQQAWSASVRDTASLRLLEEIGVDTSRMMVTADPAWTLQPASASAVGSILDLEDMPVAPRTITVAVRPWSDGSWMDPLAAALDRLVEEMDARVLFVPFQQSPHPHENDPATSLEVLRRMARIDRAAIVRGGYSVDERMALIAQSDLLVGMRLHSAIFGVAAGVPTVALSYDEKVRTAMAEAGREDLVLHVGELSAELVLDRARAALSAAADQGPVEELRRRAASNREILGGGEAPAPMSEETVEALAALVTAHSRHYAEQLSETRRLLRHVDGLNRELEAARRQIEAIDAQRRELAGTKAVQVVNRYWKVREDVRETVRAVGRKAPERVRPALRRLAGVTTPAIEGPTPPPVADPEARRRAEREVAEVLARHPDVPGVVVYPPSIGWNVSLFQRPQQMALAFSRLGYLVFYGVDDREGIGESIQQRADRLYLAPVSWAMMEALGSIRSPITVSYVYNFKWTKLLQDPQVIFEHIDELEVFTTTHALGDLRSWYEEALAGAPIVAASARDLLEKVRPRRPDALLCPNGVEYRHFAGRRPTAPPEDIADIAGGERPVIGYYGAIAEWVDYPLIRKAALELPDHEFVFIGPDYDGSVRSHLEVFDLPNVRWLGVKDYADLPAYLHWFDVATIPFVVNEVTHSVSPIKLFEYFAGGRPVVTPALRECAHYEAVLVAEDPDDYVAKLQKAVELRRDEEYLALLDRTARANTWEMRAGTLIDALARAER